MKVDTRLNSRLTAKARKKTLSKNAKEIPEASRLFYETLSFDDLQKIYQVYKDVSAEHLAFLMV